MKYDKYISTTLPYANSVPHIGHALEFIQADSLVKYFRHISGESVYFNIGIDENGLKVYTKAQELGLDTQEYLDSLCLKWTEFCRLFQIGPNNFYRTTNSAHHVMVKKFWNDSLERGDLYKKTYSGKYCTGCESFKTEADLIEGKCPDHNTIPDVIEEENWFYQVEKHKGLVYGWLQANKDFLQPSSKTPELENIILASEDISVSRLKKNVPWGIEVPNDPDQVIYVWFEALMNYIFAVQEFNDQHFIQICGPDNLRFQGSLFQNMLMSKGYNNTKKLLVHGTILDSTGKKMSKSLGNVIDPIDQLDKYGLDAVRYYALAGLSTYGNGCWDEKELVQLYNSELADDFGNLISRTLHLIDTKNVKIDLENIELFTFPDDTATQYKTEIVKKIDKVTELWDSYEINQALKETNSMVKLANKYINDCRPWEQGREYINVLNNIYFTLNLVNELYLPILSTETYSLIKQSLINKKKVIIFKKLEK